MVHIQTLGSSDDLSSLLPAWRKLADEAAEPNSFYTPELLLPALEHLIAEECRLVFIWNDRKDHLIGFFPLQLHRTYRGIPVKTYCLLTHLHCFLCSPLVHRDFANEACQAFLNWLDTRKVMFLELRRAAASCPFVQTLLESKGRAVCVIRQFERATLENAGSADDYWMKSLSKQRRRQYRKKEKHLAEHGELSYLRLERKAELDRWTEEFLRLEGSGWKAKAGSALQLHEKQRTFFSEVLKNCFDEGKLHMFALHLNGTPLAMHCSFQTQKTAYAFKIAYDEEFGKYSPGALLQVHLNKYFLTSHEIHSLDSCAEPDHPLLDHVCPNRKSIVSLDIAKQAFASRMAVRGINTGRRLYKKWK